MANNTGGAITALATWATLPVGMRPSATCISSAILLAAGTAGQILFQTSGVISIGISAANTAILPLDGLAFSLS